MRLTLRGKVKNVQKGRDLAKMLLEQRLRSRARKDRLVAVGTSCSGLASAGSRAADWSRGFNGGDLYTFPLGLWVG